MEKGAVSGKRSLLGRETGKLVLSVAVLLAVLGAGVLARTGAAAFPGKPGRIVFDDPSGNVSVVGSNGMGLRRLVSSTGPGDGFPTWSPDGKRIAFVRSDEIYLMDADGSHVTQLPASGDVPCCDTIVDGAPAWSPDGKRVAFTRFDGTIGGPGSVTIAVASVSGGSATTVTKSRVVNAYSYLAWSPTGTWIAFTGSNSAASQIWLVHPNGTGLRQLTSGPDSAESPDWSPDGSKLVFDRFHGANPPVSAQPPQQLYVVNANGSGLKQLTRSRGGNSEPAWSPDGTEVAFASSRNASGPDTTDIYTIDLATNHVARVTKNGLTPSRLSWQP